MDPFDQSDSQSYDPLKIVTTVQDDKGHSQNIQVPLPKHIKPQLMQFVENKAFPEVRSLNDLLRDAIFRELHALREIAVHRREHGLPAELEKALAYLINQHIVDRKLAIGEFRRKIIKDLDKMKSVLPTSELRDYIEEELMPTVQDEVLAAQIKESFL